MDLLLQRDAGWPRSVYVVDHGVTATCGNLKVKLTRAKHSAQTSVEKVLDLSTEALDSGDDIRISLTAVEGSFARGLRSVKRWKLISAALD